ncbi:hypothetical protein [Archangium lipolyticum]|uniref:hypothetical protein n=1 Tax=Archangium lipolyticum TaxID=2970465 RepID=UPI002149A475|nr:hypothetical protein [Archangium lipolyticum]
MMLSTLVRVLAAWLVLLLSPMAAASDDTTSSGAAPRALDRVTAGELSEMSPAERRALFQEAAPGIPMPANFGTDELDDAQEEISGQYYQGMADTLRVLSQTSAANAAALPPVSKPVELAARGATSAFGNLSRAAEFGIKPYGELRSILLGSGLRAHHLIEQRFASLMGQDARKMLAIAVTPAEHQAFTNAWRQVIPYGQGTVSATRQQVLDAARQIYSRSPEVLKALGL